MTTPLYTYGRLIVMLGLSALAALLAPDLFSLFEHSGEGELLAVFFEIAIICAFSFLIFYLANRTVIPSFVVAIFFGLALQPLLAPVVSKHATLGAIVGFGATLILFGGGLETPFHHFRKLIWKITSLSFIGLLVTAILFSYGLVGIGALLGVHIPMVVAILLGAVLASTDPAAIIPVLKRLRFTQRSTKDIIISESALTDVTGTLLTVVFLSMVTAGISLPSVAAGYAELFSPKTGVVLLRQVGFGVLFGVLGFVMLEMLTRVKRRHVREHEADAAFFLFVPVVIFTAALTLGGSGYLAAFVAGLLFSLTEHLHDTERFFNHTIEGFLKPTIFLLLGALVNVQSLVTYAWVGILSALLFMFVIRPIAVFIGLGPFAWIGRERVTWRELLFISFVRETGAIPAVLLVTIVSLGLTGLEALVPIGMWVILLTLIIEPPLTPLVARWLGVAVPMQDETSLPMTQEAEPYVVLGTRGNMWQPRLGKVAEWAGKHRIGRVILLLCLEDEYTPQREAEIRAEAQAAIDRINAGRSSAGQPPFSFSIICRKGLLQENIERLAHEQENVSAIFVGRKVLDYRLAEIKELSVPLFFME